MAGNKSRGIKRTVRKVQNRRRQRGRRGANPTHTSIPSSGLRRYPVMRAFSLFSKQWNETDKTSWLDYMKTFGAIAMKIFTTLVLSDSIQSTWAMTGVVQALVFGAEDLAWSSPIKEDKLVSCRYYRGKGAVAKLAPSIGYTQGKIQRVTIRVTCGSELAKRAGRIVIAPIALTYDEADAYRKGNGRTVPSFEEIMLMPGAVTAPTGVATVKSFSFRGTDFGSELQRIGQATVPGEAGPAGGFPTLVVYVGYQDMASTTPDPALLYAPEEAMINVDISGSIFLRESASSWIRKWPIVERADTVTCRVGNERFDVPISLFNVKEGVITLPRSSTDLRMSRFIDIVALEGEDCTFAPFDDQSLRDMEEDLPDGFVFPLV